MKKKARKKRKTVQRKPTKKIPDLLTGKWCIVEGDHFLAEGGQYGKFESGDEVRVFDSVNEATTALEELLSNEILLVGSVSDGSRIKPLKTLLANNYYVDPYTFAVKATLTEKSAARNFKGAVAMTRRDLKESLKGATLQLKAARRSFEKSQFDLTKLNKVVQDYGYKG